MKRIISKVKKIKEGGQALTEFAIFGSILLFCVAALVQYGLQANYQQQVQMEAFRKAQKMAFYRSGPNASTSLVVVKNKAIPDPRDQFGNTEYGPVAAGESVTWDTNLSAQYIKKFTDTPGEKDLPAVYFDIDKGNLTELNTAIPANKRPGVPQEAGINNAFGLYTARFEKRACPAVVTVVVEDRNYSQGTAYVEKRIRNDQIWVARIEGIGFGEGEITTDPNYPLLMYPYYRDETEPDLIKHRITDADVDGDGQLEYVFGADKNKNLFYMDYRDPYKANSFTSPATVAGQIQIDSTYTQVDAGDRVKVWNGAKWVPGPYLNPEDRQGMTQDFQKTSKYTENKIIKTETPTTLSSQTTLNAKQTIIQKFKLNNGQVVNIPVEITTDPNRVLYNWSKK